MTIAGIYSFNNGQQEVEATYPELLEEIQQVICSIDASLYKTKESREKTMLGKMLFSPVAINNAFKKAFAEIGEWNPVRVPCLYPKEYYVNQYEPKPLNKGAFREMDFVKDHLGVEVQFGKYAFMVYNVCAKMTIFRNLGHIKCGVEIVPVKAFADAMSSGVSYFEQFVWDLKHRGVSNIDIPVLIIGIDE
ncbi:MAG: restriction endonuclease [Chlorobi bacterium]|nr:restriction endonuclease [Chlorobiota bacterium]